MGKCLAKDAESVSRKGRNDRKEGFHDSVFFSESFIENLQETPFSPFSVPALLFDLTVATFAPVA